MRIEPLAERIMFRNFCMTGNPVPGLLLTAFAVTCGFGSISSACPQGNAGSAESRSDQMPPASSGISGTLILIGGGEIPTDAVAQFRQGVTPEGTIVVIGDAADTPDEAAADAVTWLKNEGIRQTIVIPSDPNTPDRSILLAGAIDKADGVWLCGGQQSRLAQLDSNGTIESALRRLLQRNGVVAGTSAGAAILSRVMIASGTSEPEIASGWDLLPDAIIDQHFTERDRQTRARKAVDDHPGRFGLGIDESTAVIVKGRRCEVVGQGTATVLLSACRYRAAEEIQFRSGEVADLTQLRRAAQQRASGIDPGIPKSGGPRVDRGSLIIVGGGGMPRDIVDRFVSLAGGADARIVVLPTAVPREQSDSAEVPGFLARVDVRAVTVLPQRGPEEVMSDEFRSALESATGIWFGGGRQWNFVDAYDGTDAVRLFHDVLARGGVIGGSSAGATIQGEFLVRGHPLGNTVMMAEGYERGFSFLPGTAIDQHFSQRNRHPDLMSVVRRHPGLLGIGIDEGTAIVVRGSTADVIGQHAAHFITHQQLHNQPGTDADPAEFVSAYTTVRSGESIDLRTFAESSGSDNAAGTP